MQPTTPLRHYPYENENVFCDKSNFVGRSKVMTHHNPFDVNPSEHPSNELPFDFFDRHIHYDPVFNPGPNYYQEQIQNFGHLIENPIEEHYPRQSTTTNEVQEVETTDDEEDEEDVKDIVHTTPVTSRKMTSPIARKYNKKSDQEKRSPEYRQARERNNEAVRRTRQKNKEFQEAEKKKSEKLKQDFKALQQKYDEQEKAINLIRQLQNEVRANPSIIPRRFYPSFSEILRFK